MTENTIGLCQCPVCGSRRASLRLSAKQMAYIVCNACNMQAFARSDVSDSRMRSMLVKSDEKAPAPAPAPAPVAAPAPAPVAARTPAPAVNESSGWGMSAWMR